MFFRLSPDYFGAFHKRITEVYSCGCRICITELNLSIGDSFKQLLTAGKNAFKRLHEIGSYSPKDLKTETVYQDLINQTYEVFNFAVTDNDMPAIMRTALQGDAFLFGGLKTHAQLFEASKLMLDENGNLKSFNQVSNAFDKLNVTYNKTYLEAEYEFAAASAQSAANWASFSDDTERYNLQYRTAGDNRVRDEHAALNRITLPKDDPFWDNYNVPNGWRCRCKVIEVLADKYTKSDSKEAIAKGEKATSQIGKDGKNRLEIFRFNPGKEKRLFPKTPVNNLRCAGDGKFSITGLIGAPVVILSLEKSKCEAAKIIQEMRSNKNHINRQEIYNKPLNEQYKTLFTHKGSGGKVIVHELVNRKSDDYKDLLKASKELARNGNVVKLLPEISEKDFEARSKILNGLVSKTKNPDLKVNDEYLDLKRPKQIKNITGKANEAYKQGAIALISDAQLKKPLNEKVLNARADAILNEKNKFYLFDKIYFFNNGKIIIKYNSR